MKYLLILILALGGGFVGGYFQRSSANLGATTARTTITNPWTYTATTTMNGNLIVTTTNTATSSLVVGCWQFYATSTATALKYQASTTPGIMYSQYGYCPKLP